MAKTKPLGHVDNHPWASFAQAQPSFPIAFKIVSGQAPELSLGDKAKTIDTVVSFAGGMAFPHHHEDGLRSADKAAADADPDCCALKAWASEGQEGVRGWSDWFGMAVKLLAFLQELLRSEGE